MPIASTIDPSTASQIPSLSTSASSTVGSRNGRRRTGTERRWPRRFPFDEEVRLRCRSREFDSASTTRVPFEKPSQVACPVRRSESPPSVPLLTGRAPPGPPDATAERREKPRRNQQDQDDARILVAIRNGGAFEIFNRDLPRPTDRARRQGDGKPAGDLTLSHYLGHEPDRRQRCERAKKQGRVAGVGAAVRFLSQERREPGTHRIEHVFRQVGEIGDAR